MSSAVGPRPTEPEGTGEPRRSPARAYIGLGLLGWGLSIMLQVAPHEDPIVGAALAVFGVALIATAPRRPQFDRMPALVVGGIGLATAATVLTYDALAHSPLDLPKLALIALGAALMIAAPFLSPKLRFQARTRTIASTFAACSLAALGVPLFVWGFQAVFEHAAGATPIEAFVHTGLLIPLAALLTLLGWHPSVAGQTISYTTLHGPINVQVGAACSGVEAMALFSAVLALFLVQQRPSGARLAIWTCIGVAGVYVANLLRLVMLAIVGYYWGVDALLRAHAQAGWIFFVTWSVVFAFMARKRAPGASTWAPVDPTPTTATSAASGRPEPAGERKA